MTGAELRRVVDAAIFAPVNDEAVAGGVLRKIVDALGITREMVDDVVESNCGNWCKGQDFDCSVCSLSDALRTLLDAAEAPGHGSGKEE